MWLYVAIFYQWKEKKCFLNCCFPWSHLSTMVTKLSQLYRLKGTVGPAQSNAHEPRLKWISRSQCNRTSVFTRKAEWVVILQCSDWEIYLPLLAELCLDIYLKMNNSHLSSTVDRGWRRKPAMFSLNGYWKHDGVSHLLSSCVTWDTLFFIFPKEKIQGSEVQRPIL